MSKTSSRRHPHKLRACVQFLRSNGDCDSRICSDRSSILQPTISYDRPGVLAAFSKQHGITFPLLSDVGSATIKWYGILNPVPEWAIGPDKDDPEVKAAVQKYVSVVDPNPTMVELHFLEPPWCRPRITGRVSVPQPTAFERRCRILNLWIVVHGVLRHLFS